jgi:hypothetical protein
MLVSSVVNRSTYAVHYGSMNANPEMTEAKPRKPSRVRIRVVAISVLLLIAASGICIVAIRRNPVPAEFRKAQESVTFPIYYPSDPPFGFSLIEASLSHTSQVVMYSYSYDKTKKINVSVQPRDSRLDTSQFKPTSEFTTYIGRAYVVDLEERTSAAVMGETSWALVNAPDKIAVSRLQDFIDSLRLVSQP